MAARARRQPAPEPAPVLAPALPEFGAYRLDDLRFCRCKFPTALVRGEHRFCGRPTTIDASNRHGSWCDEHRAVVFTPRPVMAALKARRS